jgi:L-aminopeptidase/D-esterase-like protein
LNGLQIGHAQNAEAATGCTVLIGPFRGAVDVRGLATGSRELDALSPLHIVERIDAVLLTGGSAFGLAAADGVMAWLAENGYGYDTGPARVPIVPSAVIFDLGIGRSDIRPDAAMGRAACTAATSDYVDGRVGAGTGATAGKLLGPTAATRTGLGIANETVAGYDVLALAVVNPLGDVLRSDGRVIAGAQTPTGFADSRALLARMQTDNAPAVDTFHVTPGTNTTLVAVVTDAPLSRLDLARMARIAATGIARRIAPVNTPFDGDVLFALSTSTDAAPVSPQLLLAIGSTAAVAVENAIERAATTTART